MTTSIRLQLGPLAFVLALGAFIAACDTQDRQNPSGTSHKIVGYVLGDRGVDAGSIDATKLTHINYAFANVVGSKVTMEQDTDSANVAELRTLKDRNPALKIILSVGGWVWSDDFSDAALTDSSRETFAQSAIDVLTTYGFDGIDIDWEYPGQIGEGNVYRPEDREHFTLLLKTLREHLDAQSARDGRGEGDRYVLTIATGASATYLHHTELDKTHPYLDFINIMTYDFHGAWTDSTGHHANLYPSGHPWLPSAEEAVAGHLKAGVPAHKIVLGVPFYGRGWTDVKDENHGLHQPYSGTARSYSFESLQARYINKNGYVRYWDDAAKAPYLWQPDSAIFITYDDEVSLQQKAAFAKENGLGGVMYWEHHNDPGQILLSALYEQLGRR
ncbi:MAG: glycoside hydrolase family 18 protein [Rhodothermales bacterium]